MDKVFHGVATPVEVLESNDLLFKGLPKRFNVGRYHSWVINKESFPKELMITSTEENGQVMSVKHKNYKVYGVQFHPESILTDHGMDMITNFLEIE